MKIRLMAVAGLAFMLASTVSAQSKFSGTVQCGKPDPNYSIEVGDQPGHTYMLQKSSCKWSSVTEISGLKLVDDVGVDTSEEWTTKTTASGSRVVSTDNGDKMFVSTKDSSPIKDKMPTNIAGTFTITGGTGKLKGIKGHGTYKVTPAADGTASVTVEGEYTMAAPAAAKAKPAAK
jgi:hypothetical protein